MLLDQAVDRAPVRGQVRGLPVGLLEHPQKVVGELRRHVVHVNPNHRRIHPYSRPLRLPPPDAVVELLRRAGGGGGLGGEAGSGGGEKFVEGGDEGVLGRRGVRVRVRV